MRLKISLIFGLSPHKSSCLNAPSRAKVGPADGNSQKSDEESLNASIKFLYLW